jgi:subtilisin family serine protease
VRKIALLIACFALAFATVSHAVYVEGLDNSASETIVMENQFVVQLVDGSLSDGVTKGFGLYRVGIPSVERVFDRYGVSDVIPMGVPGRSAKSQSAGNPLRNYLVVRTPEGTDGKAFRQELLADPNVKTVENDVMCKIDTTPDDTEHYREWALYQSTRHDVHAHEAWELERGSDTAIIAVVDTGVLFRHKDLRNNIWINPYEDLDGDMIIYDSTDLDHIDNDGNGYIDDFHGYDFFSGGSEPAWPGEDANGPDNDPSDFNGHGTHCAGIAAGVMNNDRGIASLGGGWGPSLGGRGVQIMCLRAGYSAPHPDYGYETGYLVMSAVAQAITYAADNGADVITYSAGSSLTSALSDAYDWAMANGLVFSVSAGNDNNDTPSYLAGRPGTLAVAATTGSDVKASFSNYGTWVSVSSPGTGIFSTYSNHYAEDYEYLSGTSMAAPLVGGLAAFLKSHFPNADKSVIDTMIINNTDNIDAENPFYVGLLGSGRINAYNCLANVPVARFSASTQVGEAPLQVDFTDESPAATSWLWDFGDGNTSMDQNPTHIYNDPGLYTVTLDITDPNGSDHERQRWFVFATADTLRFGDAEVFEGDPFSIDVTIHNTIPLDWFMLPVSYPINGTASLNLDSVTVNGTRAENFLEVDTTALATTVQKFALQFISWNLNATNYDPMTPGDGSVVRLWFTGQGDGTVTVDTTTINGKYYQVSNRYYDYLPVVQTGQVTVNPLVCGDADLNGTLAIPDAVYLINWIFKGGPAPAHMRSADATCDSNVNVQDAVHIVNYIFKGGFPPCCI